MKRYGEWNNCSMAAPEWEPRDMKNCFGEWRKHKDCDAQDLYCLQELACWEVGHPVYLQSSAVVILWEEAK